MTALFKFGIISFCSSKPHTITIIQVKLSWISCNQIKNTSRAYPFRKNENRK